MLVPHSNPIDGQVVRCFSTFHPRGDVLGRELWDVERARHGHRIVNDPPRPRLWQPICVKRGGNPGTTRQGEGREEEGGVGGVQCNAGWMLPRHHIGTCSITAEQQNSRTAEQQNSRTAGQEVFTMNHPVQPRQHTYML